MCSTDPNLPKESRTAKCCCIAAFVFSIFSMIGFGAGTSGIIGAICGILACIACSMIMCCGPTPGEGGGKYMGAFVLLLIAGIVQIAMGVWIIITLVTVSVAVTDSDGLYGCVTCTTDSTDWDCSAYSNKCTSDTTNGVTTTGCDVLNLCTTNSDAATTAVVGFLAIIFGIAAAFQFAAGILNLVASIMCFKAKGAMEKAKGNPGA
jgi:hypothetical protein